MPFDVQWLYADRVVYAHAHGSGSIADAIGMSEAIVGCLDAASHDQLYVVVEDRIKPGGSPPVLREVREASQWLSHPAMAGVLMVKNPNPFTGFVQKILMVSSGSEHWFVNSLPDAIEKVQALVPELRDVPPADVRHNPPTA